MSEEISATAGDGASDIPRPQSPEGWRELLRKEDWWSVWLGLGVVIITYALFANGSNLGWIAVAPAKWTTFSQLQGQLAANVFRYLVQFVAFLIVLTAATSLLGHRPKAFIPSFVLIYVLSGLVFVAGAWAQAQRYNLEPPLLALFVGLIISNLFRLPRTLDAGFRVEFYIKVGIVLLGATLPFTLILWAGPVAILQASIVSILTFLTIFFTARKLGLENSLAATLGAGGAVCGVSAAIAVAGAVRAKKEHPPIAITLVVLWAILFVFALPLVSRALHLPAGQGGAWIGTSEFADAAGLAAAQSYGGLAGPATGITGTADQALASYTLIKVIGRDVWIGIWAFVLAIISVTRWERNETGRRPDAKQIWWRFPKFVIGFLAASLLVTLVVRHFSLADYNRLVKPGLVAPITALRTWAFTFSFLSIGLTTRLREFAPAGGRPFWAFSAGVLVNVVLGYVLSVLVFGHYWANLAP
jgi:uncharacterized membrane protein YadS